jgi:hypothetical protein
MLKIEAVAMKVGAASQFRLLHQLRQNDAIPAPQQWHISLPWVCQLRPPSLLNKQEQIY